MVMQNLHRISDRTRVDTVKGLFGSDARLVIVFATDMKNYIRQFLNKF